MKEKTYQVRLLHTEGGYLHLAYENLRTKIKDDLIELNQLKVIDNKVELDSGFFMHWFAESIEAELAQRVDYYLKHIPLIWANRELIINEPRYYSVETPKSFLYGSVHNPYRTIQSDDYTPFTFGDFLFLKQIWMNEDDFTAYTPYTPFPLGCLLQLWMNEDAFTAQCAECGGKAVPYTIGLTITGKPWCNHICLKCGKIGSYRPHAPYDQIREILKKYEKMKPISEPSISFEELVEVISLQAR